MLILEKIKDQIDRDKFELDGLSTTNKYENSS